MKNVTTPTTPSATSEIKGDRIVHILFQNIATNLAMFKRESRYFEEMRVFVKIKSKL